MRDLANKIRILRSHPGMAVGLMIGLIQATYFAPRGGFQSINRLIRSPLAEEGGGDFLPPDQEGASESEVAWSLLLLLALELFAFFTAYILKKTHFKYLQEAAATMLFGTLIGLCTKWATTETAANLRNALAFDKTVFFLFLLPPIIFESGYSMKKKKFFQNLGSIIGYAFGGTLIATFVTGFLLWVVVQMNVMTNLTFLECLLWGSLISATDPVTVLAIFKELRVDLDLYSNVFGESVLNDAVAIVLYKTLSGFLNVEVITAGYFFKAIGQFVVIFVGSMGFGIVIGLLSALTLKHTHVDKYPYLESAIVALFGYSSYLIAEGPQLSGIVSILFCGIVMGQYTYENLSQESKELTMNFFSIMALLTETLVFGYLGLSLFIFPELLDFGFIFAGIAIILIARAVNVYPLTALINYFRRTSGGTIITQRYQFFTWFAGLRGAIAFILAIEAEELLGSDAGRVMKSTTIAIVYFTIFVFGGLTIPLLNKLGIPQGIDPNAVDTEEDAYGRLTVRVQSTWGNFNKTKLQPFFTKGYASTYDNVELGQSREHGARDVDLEEEVSPQGAVRIQFSQPEAEEQ
jgi:sodium/hydrogen exchanger 3